MGHIQAEAPRDPGIGALGAEKSANGMSHL
jgi:hypothetical protein